MSESQLIEALIEGSEPAFRTIVETYQQKVFNTCLGFIKNVDDADDLTQEVFIEVFKSIHQFRMESSLSTWIYRISVTKSLELIRSRKRLKRFAGFGSFFGWGNLPQEPVDYKHPGVVAENRERSEILFKAIEKLPETQYTAYTLHKLEGLSYQEIADIMKKSVSSVESMMHRAKLNLQKQLYEYYSEL
jgi:RNA polymerase sigma-70 factor (ECF subfamily)